MAPACQPADREQIREAVRSRYSGLARAAQAGETVTDCDPGAFSAGCFGAAGYPDARGLPDGAVRAGFTGISIISARQVADGLHSAIIRAARP